MPGRPAALAATRLDVGLVPVRRPAPGNTGVWVAFLANYVFRAGGLAVGLPGLFASQQRSSAEA